MDHTSAIIATIWAQVSSIKPAAPLDPVAWFSLAYTNKVAPSLDFTPRMDAYTKSPRP